MRRTITNTEQSAVFFQTLGPDGKATFSATIPPGGTLTIEEPGPLLRQPDQPTAPDNPDDQRQ